MRRISIFGATGSIGQNTIDLIARDPAAYDVVALTGAGNVNQLARDAIALNAEIAVTADDGKLDALRAALSGTPVQAAAGEVALCEAAQRPVDWAMSAIVGAAGLPPGLEILKQGATLALANKESLVTAGPLVMQTARENAATVLPVDSEHSAVFQGLVGEDIAAVERIIITASGGAFRDWPVERLAKATVADASAHPNWVMGQRITIDSASMFNKSLELIETREFFGVDPGQVEVLVHPQSLIHALVGFRDGALMAHIGPPDMRHAIGYALHWPERKALPVDRLDLAQIARLEFTAPDTAKYPALRLARQVMETRGHAGAVFNAAKEAALDGFIAGQIPFPAMAEVVEAVLDRLSSNQDFTKPVTNLDRVREMDHLARKSANDAIMRRAGS